MNGTWLVVNALATFYMTGLIWFVQVVHYPLYDRVGAKEFARYEADHTSLTGLVVGPPMLVELGSALACGSLFPMTERVVSLGLVGVIWVSTAVFSIPAHNRLQEGFDAPTAQRLVWTNWIRTIAWTLRSLLICKLLLEKIRL